MKRDEYKGATYRAWEYIKRACTDPAFRSYEMYGGSGIYLCEKWQSFAGFVEDMGECADGYILSRIELEKGYSPDNCAWIPESAIGRSLNGKHAASLDGFKAYYSEWESAFGMKPKTLKGKVASRKTFKEALGWPGITDTKAAIQFIKNRRAGK